MPNQPDPNQTWETRKKEARKLIRQKSEAVTYNPGTTTVALNSYTIYFMEHNGRIIYLGERDPEGNYR